MGPDKQRFVRLLTACKTLYRSSSCYEELVFISLVPLTAKRVDLSALKLQKQEENTSQYSFSINLSSVKRETVRECEFPLYLALGAEGYIKKNKITKHKTHKATKTAKRYFRNGQKLT